MNVNNFFDEETSREEVSESESTSELQGKKKKKKKEISYKQEMLRKLIHLCSLSIPIGYIFLSKETALTILLPLASAMIIIDIITKKVKPIKKIYQKYFGAMLRKHEKKKKKLLLNGASWVLISAVLTVLIFPKIIAVTAFAILIISDISAALIGRKFGKTPLFNKSWEGTVAFMVSAIAVVFAIGLSFDAPISYFIIGGIAAIIGAFAEAASKLLKTDDNFSIPISIGVFMWAAAWATQNHFETFLNLL